MKMTLRNIGNAEMYGRVSALTDTLLRSLIDKANERLAVDQRMLLNEANLQKHVQDEQAVIQAKEEWIQQQSEKGEGKEEEEKPDSESNNGAEEGDVDAKEDSKGKEANQKVSYAAATAEPKPLLFPPSESSYLATRLLYVVTPKKTRRRGEKPGSVYLVLTAPPIKARTPPPKPTPTAVVETGATATSDDSVAKDVPGEAAPVDGGTAPVAVSEQTVAANNETSSTPAAAAAAPSNSKPPVVQQVDYSRDIAERRLMLVRAVEALSAVAQQDATSKQEYAGCQVEESRNAKAWKAPPSEGGGGRHYGGRDRLEGTLADSADYKAFLESVVKEKEELKARPKPAPGGGTVAPSSVAATAADGTITATTATTENGEPIAALVMHLRTKQEEAKSRKKAKRKSKEAANANVKNIQQSGAKSSSKGAKKEESGKKKKAKSKRKKARPRGGGGGAKNGATGGGVGGGGGNSGGVKT